MADVWCVAFQQCWDVRVLRPTFTTSSPCLYVLWDLSGDVRQPLNLPCVALFLSLPWLICNACILLGDVDHL